MNPRVGWALAALLVGLAWHQYGWRGVLFAGTAVVFWLLLQFNRSVRVMRSAAQAPVGQVDSAVMLNARLRPGMSLLQVVALTRSLGRRLDAAGDAWAWADASASRVELWFRAGRLQRFTLIRPDGGEAPTPGP